MMTIFNRVEASFLAQSKIYFQQEDNFSAHADYLRNGILRKYRSEYDEKKFNAAVDVATTDIDAGVTQLFYAVQGALRKMLDEQIQKGQELVGSYQNGKRVLQDQGNRKTRVQSEQGNNILYHVDLHDYTEKLSSKNLITDAVSSERLSEPKMVPFNITLAQTL